MNIMIADVQSAQKTMEILNAFEACKTTVVLVLPVNAATRCCYQWQIQADDSLPKN